MYIMSVVQTDFVRVITAFSGVLGSLGLIVTHQIPKESLDDLARGLTYTVAAILHLLFAWYIGRGFYIVLYALLFVGVYTSALIQLFTEDDDVRRDATMALNIIHPIMLVVMVMVLTQERCLYMKRV